MPLVKNENPHCDHCGEWIHKTHTTEEHDENWVLKQEPCDECGAGEGEECHPSCRWAECPVCGKQQDDCNYGREHP
jgi:hypothetical protein